jgi:ribose transport system permease protein
MKKQINFRHHLLKNWVLLFLLFLIFLFSILEPSFFSMRNFNNILIASTAILLLAAGETFVIISGGIDLSLPLAPPRSCSFSSPKGQAIPNWFALLRAVWLG